MKPAYFKTATRALVATTVVALLVVSGCNERTNTTTNTPGGTDVNTTDSATIVPDSMTTMMDTSMQMMDTSSQGGTQ